MIARPRGATRNPVASSLATTARASLYSRNGRLRSTLIAFNIWVIWASSTGTPLRFFSPWNNALMTVAKLSPRLRQQNNSGNRAKKC